MLTRNWPLAVLLLCLGTVVSVLWVDHPLARVLADFSGARLLLRNPHVHFPLFVVLACGGIGAGLGYRLLGLRLPRPVEAAMFAGAAILIAMVLTEDVLKPIFSRPQPITYLLHGSSGFHWFHWNYSRNSFPSGHATEASALFGVGWAYYPRLRWVFVALFTLLALALMLGQWHFLGDILAGALVGSGVAALTLHFGKPFAQQRPV